MNNYKQEKAGIGKELFITNYPVDLYVSTSIPGIEGVDERSLPSTSSMLVIEG